MSGAKIVPTLQYHMWTRDKAADKCDPSTIVALPEFDGTPAWLLHDVHEVTAYLTAGGALNMWVRGRMLKKNGRPGPSRGAEVDVQAAQPQWLADIIADARARLAVQP